MPVKPSLASAPVLHAFRCAPMGTARKFPSTDWSVVVRAKARSTRTADGALATLCEHYWYPLYGFLRQRGYREADAQDLTQAFLASVVEKNRRRRILPDHGRFRSFLLTALLNFVANEQQRAHAQKRRGVERPPTGEPADHMTPE